MQLRRFASPDLCADLIALIERIHRPSTIAVDNGDTYFRTSETCDLAEDLPAVQQIEALLIELSNIAPTYGEPLQGKRYTQGQEFKPHTDHIDSGGRDFAQFCTLSVQRNWTFMIYLNDVAAGGAIRFKLAGKIFFQNGESAELEQSPRRWPQCEARGIKYVITK